GERGRLARGAAGDGIVEKDFPVSRDKGAEDDQTVCGVVEIESRISGYLERNIGRNGALGGELDESAGACCGIRQYTNVALGGADRGERRDQRGFGIYV